MIVEVYQETTPENNPFGKHQLEGVISTIYPYLQEVNRTSHNGGETEYYSLKGATSLFVGRVHVLACSRIVSVRFLHDNMIPDCNRGALYNFRRAIMFPHTTDLSLDLERVEGANPEVEKYITEEVKSLRRF